MLREYVRHRVEQNPRPQKSIAGDMDLSPSVLSRKLSPQHGDTNRFNCDDLERYMAVTGDTAPIEYLAAKYLQAPELRQAAAIARVEALATELEHTLQSLRKKT